MQRQDKLYVATSTLSVRMPIVLPKQKQNAAIHLMLLMQKNTIEIDLSNISFCVKDSAKIHHLEWC